MDECDELSVVTPEVGALVADGLNVDDRDMVGDALKETELEALLRAVPLPLLNCDGLREDAAVDESTVLDVTL